MMIIIHHLTINHLIYHLISFFLGLIENGKVIVKKQKEKRQKLSSSISHKIKQKQQQQIRKRRNQKIDDHDQEDQNKDQFEIIFPFQTQHSKIQFYDILSSISSLDQLHKNDLFLGIKLPNIIYNYHHENTEMMKLDDEDGDYKII